MNRAYRRVLQAAVLAVGAPLGWLLLRRARGTPMRSELRGAPDLYGYLFGGTAAAFAAFGYVLGRREERLVQANRRLDSLALTDSLTGLRNPRYFWTRLREEHAAVQRGEAPLALILFDIDHFKGVNDRYGHPAGDRVLEMIGEVFRTYARQQETAARVGGEEFALILPGHTGYQAKLAAERIRDEVARRPVTVDDEGRRVRVTLSGGVAERAAGADHGVEQLYAEADRALYRAKEEGRDRVVVASSPAEATGD